MWELLRQLNDEEMDFTVTVTDTDGVKGEYEFLDIVNLEGSAYAVLAPTEDDGYVDIFRIIQRDGKELYERVENDSLLDEIFEIFRIKNEDEFDFD